MKRSPIHRYTKLRPVNPDRQARVRKRRARQRYSKAEKEARADAWIRSKGVCECGCDRPFDTAGDQYAAGSPEFHHTSYDPPRGQYLRRECHHRIEMTRFGYRHNRGAVA